MGISWCYASGKVFIGVLHSSDRELLAQWEAVFFYGYNMVPTIERLSSQQNPYLCLPDIVQKKWINQFDWINCGVTGSLLITAVVCLYDYSPIFSLKVNIPQLSWMFWLFYIKPCSYIGRPCSHIGYPCPHIGGPCSCIIGGPC